MKVIVSLTSPANPHYTTRKTEFLFSINIYPNHLQVYSPLKKNTIVNLSDLVEDYWILNKVLIN